MDYKTILNQLKKKAYQPIYFLYGQEAYFIDLISDYIENNVLEEAEKAFNLTIVYGKDVDARTLIDTASRYPMMAPYQVVILKEAQDMKSLKDLQPYVEKPVKTTILVICHKHKRFDGRTKFAKSLKANAVFFESKKLYENKIGAWVEQYLSTKNLSIKPEAKELIAEYLGTDLSKIANELDKLAINLPEQTLINAQHVQDNIGISKDYNVFELQKALAKKDVVKANQIVHYFGNNPKSNPLVVVIASLYNYFSKIYMLKFLKNASDKEILSTLKLSSPFFLKEYRMASGNYNLKQVEAIIHLLKETDLKSKGLNSNNTPDDQLLKELVYRILH